MSFLDPSRDALAPVVAASSEAADAVASPPANLGLLRELMSTWTHWPEKRREVIHSQIQTAAWIAKTGELRRQGKLDRIRRREVGPPRRIVLSPRLVIRRSCGLHAEVATA